MPDRDQFMPEPSWKPPISEQGEEGITSGLPLAEIVPEVLPAPRPPHPGFWWAVLWCLGFLLVTQLVPGIIGIVILIILLAVSRGGLNLDQLGDAKALMNSHEYAVAMMPAMLLSQILSILMGWLVIRMIVGKQWPRILAVRRPGLNHLVLALVGLPGLMVITMGVDGLAKQVLPSLINLEEITGLFGKWPWPVGVLIIGVGPGIGEELWCRGFLGRGLVGRYGFIGGVLLTSLLFGLIHMEPRQVAYAMVLGIPLHLSYLASRSLLVPMLLHMANNSLSILAMHIPFLKGIDMPAEQIPWAVYGAAILLTGIVGWAFFQCRARFADDPSPEFPFWRPAFPSVAYPPPGKGTFVVHPPLAWPTWALVVAAMLVFAGTCFLAS